MKRAPPAARRRLLKALAAAPLALASPAWASPAWASPSPNRLLILVFLYGGNDGFNTWVPYTSRRYYEKRPTIAVPRDAVLKLTETNGLHPSMAPVLPAWEARELAIVQGIGYPDITQQHYRDIEIAFTAEDGAIEGEGWVSRALAARSGAAAVAFDVLDIREMDPMGPFRGERMPAVQVHHAAELLATRRLADCAIATNRRGAQFVKGSGAMGPRALKTHFPQEPFARALRAAVELAAADPSIPVIHVALNGLDDDKHHSVDTHWDQLKYHGDALKRLAEGLAALRAGLREIGRWEETLVATYDEFGRSPIENADHGTHHGLGTTHFVMGGRVRGGTYGKPPPVENLHQIGGPAPAIDTRALWSTVVRDWWGADHRAVFPGRHEPLALLRA